MLKLVFLFFFLINFFYFSPYSEKTLTLPWKIENLPYGALFVCCGADHVFGLNAAMEKVCPLVIPSKFTSVSLWGITPKPSAWPLFARGIGSRGERDRERVNWKTFLWPFRTLRDIKFKRCMRSIEETSLLSLLERWKPSIGASERGYMILFFL